MAVVDDDESEEETTVPLSTGTGSAVLMGMAFARSSQDVCLSKMIHDKIEKMSSVAILDTHVL